MTMDQAEIQQTDAVRGAVDQPRPDNLCSEDVNIEATAQEENSPLILVECLLCRICGEESRDLVNVFDEQGVALNLVQKIRWHLPITVSEDDALPATVCFLCISRLTSCHEFANLCLDTEEKLMKLFSATAESEAVWKEIDSSLITRNNFTPQARARKLALPNENLMEAMNLLRHEKEEETNRIIIHASSEEGDNNSINTFETVYIDNRGFVGEIQVFDVTVDSEGVESLPPSQWTTNFEVKIPKELESSESTMANVDSSAGSVETHSMQKEGESKESNKYKCTNICDYEASSKLALLDHFSHFHSRQLPGNFCYSEIKTAKTVQDHVGSIKQVVDKMHRYICEHCGKSFRVRRTLNDHKIAHHSKTAPHKCDKCARTFTTLAGWDIHKSTHSTEEPYLCDICGKKFKHASHLHSHKRSHLTAEKKNRKLCTVCGKGFRSQFHLNEHENVHADRKPYSCGDCGKAFHKRIQLRQHGSTHLDSKPFKCGVCGMAFNRRGNMTEHVKRHKVLNKFTCGVCGKRFERTNEVREHRKTHTAEETEKAIAETNDGHVFKCNTCGKVFAKRSGLITHLQSHSGEKTHACEYCGKKLSHRGSLAYHVRAYHTGDRPHACSFCGSTFVTRESCLVHERIHTGEKPFTCSVCSTSFRCSSNLTQHLRVHSERRPFNCPLCEKSFLRKGALGVHMRTHTGERPFICDQCGKGFTQKNDMLKHARTHSAERPYTCQVCAQVFALKRDFTRHQTANTCSAQEGQVLHPAGIPVPENDDELIQGLALGDSQNLIGVLHRF